MSEADIQGEFQENYRYAHDYWAPYLRDAQVYSLCAAGYSWSDDERKQLIKEGREPLEFNIMRRPLQFFSGYLRDNINEIIYAPVEGSDQETADDFTKLSYNVWEKGTGFPVFLDACDEMFKSGIALCGIQMDYSRDFLEGDISFFKRTYNSFVLDPGFEQISLEDCSFAITRDLVGKEYAKQLLPFVDPDIINEIMTSYRDDKFLQYHPQFTTFSRNRNLLAYDQYYRRTTRTRKYLVDKRSAFYRDITELSKDETDKLKTGIGRFSKMYEDAEILGVDREQIPVVEIHDIERPYVELNVMLNGQSVYRGEDKTGVVDTYPFVPLICYMEPSIWMPSLRLQGIPATIWSAQREFNKRHMKIVDMMDSTIATGFKYLLGAVPDPQDMQQSGQNKIIGVDPENAPQGLDSVQELRGGNASPELIQYQQILDQLTLTLSNINESVLGIDDKGNTQISGRLAQVRIAQGLRSNRKVMDNIETAQQVLGGVIMQAFQSNYSPGKVERILGKKPTQQFYDRQFEQYDVVIKEGVRSKTQKDAYYYELVNLKREGIVDVPQSEIVRSLAMSGLSDLQKAIEAQEQMQSQAKAQEQELITKQMDLLDATKEEKLGLAQERRARVISNLSLKDERESEAQQNIAQAALDRAKAIVEISQLNEKRIMEVVNFLRGMEAEEATGREIQKDQVRKEADALNVDTQGTMERQQADQAYQEQVNQQQTMQEFNQGG